MSDITKLTIIVDDGGVYLPEGIFTGLDLASCNIPPDVHALQWEDGHGEIEERQPTPNISITELPQWALDCVTLWKKTYDDFTAAQQQ